MVRYIEELFTEVFVKNLARHEGYYIMCVHHHLLPRCFLPAGLLYPQLQRFHKTPETILRLPRVSLPPPQAHPVRETQVH